MIDRMSVRSTPQILLGLLIILVGVILILDRMEMVYAEDLLRYWPLLLVVYGLSRLVRPRGTQGRFLGGTLVLAGSLLLLERLDLLPFRVWDLWPLLLVIGGIAIIRRSYGRQSSAPAAAGATDTVSAFAFMGGVERTNSSQDFRGGEITAIMGGCELDLRGASLKGEAVLDVFAFWGGIEVHLPEDWEVTVTGSPILGGIEDTTRHPKGGSEKRLVVRGSVIMGGLELTN